MVYRTLSLFSASSMFLGLLPAIASVKAESASTFTDSKSGIVFQRFSAQQSSFGIALPETVESSFIGQIAVPLTNGAGWGALGLNGPIDNNIFVAAYANGADVTGSLRNADQSEVTGDYSIRTIGESTSVDKSSLLYTFLCENCLSPGVSAALNGAGDTATLGFGLSSEVVSDPASTSATLGPANSGNGTFSISLAAARNAEFPAWVALATPESSSTELKKRDIKDRSPFDAESLPLLARSVVEESHQIDRRHKNGTRRKNRTGAASRRNRSKAAKSKNGSAGAAAKANAKAKAKAEQDTASITGKTQSAQSINLFGTRSTDKSSKVNKRHANGGRKKNRTGAARAKQAAASAAANTDGNTNAGTRANANTGGGHTHSAARSVSLIDARHEVDPESLPATSRSVDSESKMAKRHAAGGGGRRRNRTGAARAKQNAAASSRGQSANTVAVREPMPGPHTQAGGGGGSGAATAGAGARGAAGAGAGAGAGTGAGAGAGTGARPQRGGGQGGNRVQRVRRFVEDFLRSRAVPEEELENDDDDDDFI